MLRLSKLADYSIVIMTCLARDADKLHAATYIAECTHLALPTVSKLLKQLAGAGLVESVRGARGGYRLVGNARDISVAHVVTAIEGPVSLTECSTDDSQCGQESFCSARENWEKINRKVCEALEDISMAEMAGVSVTVDIPSPAETLQTA